MANEIRYSIVSGSLPVGIEMNPKTGKLKGPVDFSNVGLGPVWNGPEAGSLGEFDELEEVTLETLDVTLDNGERASIGLLNGHCLPWGLALDSDTGVISGTIAELLGSQAAEALTRDGPEFVTPFGKLAGYDEGQIVELVIEAEAQNDKTVETYSIINGGLPWGLVLDTATGEITGQIGDLKAPGLTIETPKLPLPVWNTAQGPIAIVREGETVDLQIQATPATDRQMIKYCIRAGGLPWGLAMDFSTGKITGTIAELVGKTDPAYLEPEKDPTINDLVIINEVEQEVQDLGDLGTYALGDTVSIQFSATASQDRVISRYSLETGTLPFGLTLGETGLISGTLYTNETVPSATPVGTFSFTLRATDNAEAFALRSYTLTVQ